MKTSQIFISVLSGCALFYTQFLQPKNANTIRRCFLALLFSMTSMTIVAQEWDNSITITDWDQLWRSGFVQGYLATNQPEPSGWFWGINMNHSWNTADYRYNGQIAIKNDHDNPTMYFRSTNDLGTGIWAKVIDSRTSSIGTLTTLNSLKIDGTNLSTKDLTFLNNTGATLIGRNRSNGDGETNIISNRGLGSIGGFEFRDIDNSGNETLIMKLKGDGKVGIGTTAPDDKLTVKGRIHAEEVKVDLSVLGPDYVFKEGYDLKSLEEVQHYIKEKGHLPNIPSAQEMEENGVELGIMNMKLLEKIEELTLYQIQLLESLEASHTEIKELKKRIENLESK